MRDSCSVHKEDARQRKRKRAIRWLAASLIVSVLAVPALLLLRSPPGSYWRGRKIHFEVQSLKGGAFAGEGAWIHTSWSGSRGWTHGSIYGIKLGNKLLRLDVSYDPKEVIKNGLPRSLPVLLQLSNTKDSLLRECVFETLTQMGPLAKPAVPVLLQRYASGDDYAGGEVIGVAIAVGPDAVPILSHVLTNDHLKIVAKAIEALGEMETNAQAAVPALASVLTNSASSNSLAAAYALRRITKGDHGEVETLNRLLGDDDHQVRLGAIFVLGEFGEAAAPAANRLLGFLDRTNSDLAGWAARTFGMMGPAGRIAIPRLNALLNDRSSSNLTFVIQSLGQFGEYSVEAVPKLCEIAMMAKESQASFFAVKALSKMGTNAIPCLVNLYGREKPDYGALAKAFMTLGPKAEAAVPALVEQLRMANPYQAAAAAIALGSIGPEARPAVPILTELSSSDNAHLRLRAAEALWIIDRQTNTVLPVMIRELTEWSKAPDALIELQEDWNDESRQRVAARILGEIGPGAIAAVSLLQVMQRSTFAQQRDAATEALKMIVPGN